MEQNNPRFGMGQNKLRKGDRRSLLVKVLVVTSIVLALVLLYVLVVQPSITGRMVQVQNGAVEQVVVSIMQQAAQCQQVPLQYGNETINLVAIECLQQASQQQSTQQPSQKQETQ